ncbi:MAG: carboxypeptidase-like regulatory domain-containing protein [Gemmatimonadota bacterium]
MAWASGGFSSFQPMGPGGSLSGRILDAETALPIRDAVVEIVGSGEVVGTRTDERGEFHFSDVRAGSYRVRAMRLGYAAGESEVRVVDAEEPAHVTLSLQPSPMVLDSILVSLERADRAPRQEEQLIAGRVLDDGTGDPIVMGTVRLVGRTGSAVATVLSDEDGYFRLVSPAPGTYRVTVERMGYESGESSELHLMPGDSLQVEFRISTDAVLVAPLTVTASARPWANRANIGGMAPFYRRWARFERAGFGEFMTRDEIEWFEGRAITAAHMLARTTMAVRYATLQGGAVLRGACARGSGITDSGLEYWVDGAPVPGTPNLAPYDLEGVEVYTRPNITPELNLGGFPCAVIVYWTRRSPDTNAPRRTKRTLVAAVALGALGWLLIW